MNCKVVADYGVNHNGEIDNVLAMIEILAKHKVDIIKFHTKNVDTFYSKTALDSSKKSMWGETLRDEVEALELEECDYDEINEACQNYNIEWTSTPWDIQSAKMLVEKYHVPYLRIPSDLFCDLDYIKACANLGTPVVLNTGSTPENDLDNVVYYFTDTIAGILASPGSNTCSSNNINIRRIQTLKYKYSSAGAFIGYSLGAKPIKYIPAIVSQNIGMLEFPVTHDCDDYGDTQKFSVEATQVGELMKLVRNTENAMGSHSLELQEA
jgi:N-acetylneuraminate synthase